jgi:hypothetical protein
MKRLLEWQRRQIRERGEALATMEQQIFHRGFGAGIVLALAATTVAALLFVAESRTKDGSARKK